MRNLIKTFLLMLMLSFSHAAIAGDFKDGVAAYNKQDFATALRIFTPLAEQGLPLAQSNLGVMYEKGNGVAQDYKTAVKWYTLAAEQGLPPAQFNLGTMYEKGNGVAQDYKTAVKWYTLAAEQGLPLAQYNLGFKYYEGQGVVQDYNTAFKWCRLAAEQGLAEAQYALGLFYYEGQGVEQDLDAALKWFKLAAEQGNASAQSALGFMYYSGQSVAQDYKIAIKWLTLASEQGDAAAQNNLGTMYADGKGVAQDFNKAQNQFFKAIDTLRETSQPVFNQKFFFSSSASGIANIFFFGLAGEKRELNGLMWAKIAIQVDKNENAEKFLDNQLKNFNKTQLEEVENGFNKCIKSNYRDCSIDENSFFLIADKYIMIFFAIIFTILIFTPAYFSNNSVKCAMIYTLIFGSIQILSSLVNNKNLNDAVWGAIGIFLTVLIVSSIGKFFRSLGKEKILSEPSDLTP